MTFEKSILAVLTASTTKEVQGTCFIRCESIEELNTIAANLEAILDGIAHKVTEEIYVIVRH